MAEQITTTKTIRQNGTSLTVNITKEIKQLGLNRGDVVELVIKKTC